jgi:uncharacterized protein (UPF0264 family)
MTRLLISVRNVDEALQAARAGAGFIDIKDPAAGALGGLPPERIARIARVLKTLYPRTPLSATIGDLPAGEAALALERVAAVAASGVDYVKVGVERDPAPQPVVPVLLADHGVEAALVTAALQLRAFPALMLDTSDKRGGSLLQRVTMSTLARFVADVRRHGCLAGLAGALRAADVPLLLGLAPDFAGFRSAPARPARQP